MSKIQNILTLAFVIAGPQVSRATEAPPAKELSAFEKSLQMHENVSTKETIVQKGQRKFRRIEINSEIFYLQLQSDLASNADLVMLCGENPAQFGAGSAALITAAVRTTKRTRFFVEGLRMMCLGNGNQTRIGVSPEIAIGFMLDDDPDPNSILKNRRISINPVSISPMVNFNAEW
ncbi:hypothetical protein BH10BDE1_BH10BDE1_00660 [soil metagenome]